MVLKILYIFETKNINRNTSDRNFSHPVHIIEFNLWFWKSWIFLKLKYKNRNTSAHHFFILTIKLRLTYGFKTLAHFWNKIMKQKYFTSPLLHTDCNTVVHLWLLKILLILEINHKNRNTLAHHFNIPTIILLSTYGFKSLAYFWNKKWKQKYFQLTTFASQP